MATFCRVLFLRNLRRFCWNRTAKTYLIFFYHSKNRLCNEFTDFGFFLYGSRSKTYLYEKVFIRFANPNTVQCPERNPLIRTPVSNGYSSFSPNAVRSLCPGSAYRGFVGPKIYIQFSILLSYSTPKMKVFYFRCNSYGIWQAGPRSNVLDLTSYIRAGVRSHIRTNYVVGHYQTTR